MTNLDENKLTYLYCLKLAKLFNCNDEFKLVRGLYYSLLGDVIDSELFMKEINRHKQIIITAPNESTQMIIADIFKSLESKQDCVDMISYLSIIEYSVSKEDYETAKNMKARILKLKGMTEQKYFKIFKQLVTDFPVNYSI